MRGFGRRFVRRSLGMLAVCALAALSADGSGARTSVCGPPASSDFASSPEARALIERVAGEIAMQGLRVAAAQGRLSCIELEDRALCLKPDVDPALADDILRSLPSYAPSGMSKFDRQDRWATTATDGATGAVGDPITLTWSIVPDGTDADGIASILQATFNGLFGGTTWIDQIENALASQWGNKIGVTYVRELNDDGVQLPGFGGALGVRGDVRISGRNIDGGGAGGPILAYNFYPGDGGDMVLDTSEGAFWTSGVQFRNIRNVVSHENGHGLGLAHVSAPNSNQLMEPFFSSAFLGPQDDDVRGGMKGYGDVQENDDVAGDATPLGAVGDTVEAGPDSIFVRWICLDRANDVDWFLVTTSFPGEVTIRCDPVGSTYLIGPNGGPNSTVSTDSIFNLAFDLYEADGITLLTTQSAVGLGATEVLSGFSLPAPDDYLIRVFSVSGTGIQRYELTIDHEVDALTDVPAPGSAPDDGRLALVVYPNPARHDLRATFRAPAAGPVALEVFDTEGRLVRRMADHAAAPGRVEMSWSGEDANGQRLSSGVYFLRASSGSTTETVRAILVR